jgi:hypothetical protein
MFALLLGPFQISPPCHETFELMVAAGNRVLWDGFQQDQDQVVRPFMEEIVVSKVEFIMAPLTLDKVGRQHEDGLVTLLNAVYDIFHNALARNKVSLMEANPYIFFL